MRGAWPVVIALLLAGCSGDDGDHAGRSPTTTVDESLVLGAEHDYVLLDDPGWLLVEATDLSADDPRTTQVPADVSPPTDWFAVYVPTRSDADGTVTIRAVEGSLDQTAERLADSAVPTDEIDDLPWRARATVVGRDLAPISFVLVDGGEQTIVVAGDGVNDDDLVALAAHLGPIDEATWVDAGGTAEPSI